MFSFMVWRKSYQFYKTNTRQYILNVKDSINTYKMVQDSNLLKPPECVTGLKKLDRSLFEKSITIPCLNIKDTKPSLILPHIKSILLKLENFKSVKSASEEETHVYLNPIAIRKWEDLDSEICKNLESLKIDRNNLDFRTVCLTYENYSAGSILKAVLPPDIEGMSSFTKVGHIVHLNLREHLLPYKDLIGEVLFDKIANCKSVVNKTASIDNTYRNFQMEILRGVNDMHVTVKENKCIFEFDFSKVYWNSRLCTEHERIVKLIDGGDIVFDVFAGVGPFSIPLAKKKCHVFANDLNPDSFKWLNHNAKKNKIDLELFKSFNKDGRDFILNDFKEILPQFFNKKIYILMNLPALSVEFLDCFVGLFKKSEIKEMTVSPTVILYCFAKGENYNEIAKNLLCDHIGWDITDKIIELFRVRTVSSLKEMMRIVFRLDDEILTKTRGNKRKHSQDFDECGDGEKQIEKK